ncbi:MAG: nucleoside triphosphate pyrophosphohydrolase family protein [Bacteroidota bacterium]|nr:nucleoside triphosphate pyrophosphohydrolase family protein [Bacteroidota bacterium]
MNVIAQRVSDPRILRLLHAAMGLDTEQGEFMDALKKYIFYGKELDEVNLAEECGDQSWYLGIAIDVLQTTFDEVLTKNIQKLKQRYPEKFDAEHALNRNLNAEYEILSAGGTD